MDETGGGEGVVLFFKCYFKEDKIRISLFLIYAHFKDLTFTKYIMSLKLYPNIFEWMNEWKSN